MGDKMGKFALLFSNIAVHKHTESSVYSVYREFEQGLMLRAYINYKTTNKRTTKSIFDKNIRFNYIYFLKK